MESNRDYLIRIIKGCLRLHETLKVSWGYYIWACFVRVVLKKKKKKKKKVAKNIINFITQNLQTANRSININKKFQNKINECRLFFYLLIR